MKTISELKRGFTLIEMLLVMVIISTIVVTGIRYFEQRAENMRVDRSVALIQNILNAGLSFYVDNGRWPNPNDRTMLNTGTSSELQPNYLPGQPIISPMGGDVYAANFTSLYLDIPPNTFIVILYVGNSPRLQQIGQIIAGRLPLAFYSGSYVFAYTYIPTQTLNNATALNFAGLYHHGACVPVPVCPGNTQLVPQIYVMPVSVSGVNDSGNSNIYPISSFTAYAVGSTPLDDNPPYCTNQTTVTGGWCGPNKSWRVCLQVVTERGDVALTRSDNWGQYVTVSAFTRCASPTEASGSDFNVYGN